MTFPTRKELEGKFLLFQSREVLGAHEALTTVQSLIVPHLRHFGHDITVFSLNVSNAALESAWNELHRFIQLEEQALDGPTAVCTAGDPLTCECFFLREDGLKLMRLLHGTRIHNDIAIV